MDKIGGFILNNNGMFECASKVTWMDLDGNSGTTDRWDWIANGQSQTIDPSEHNVQDNMRVEMYIDIMAGNDRTGGQFFRYRVGATTFAEYTISGTTLDSDVVFNGIVDRSES